MCKKSFLNAKELCIQIKSRNFAFSDRSPAESGVTLRGFAVGKASLIAGLWIE